MPRLSDSMEEGTILRWLKSDGDEVQQGEEIAEIETDKATMTFEADAGGTLHIVADEGSTLPIGELTPPLVLAVKLQRGLERQTSMFQFCGDFLSVWPFQFGVIARTEFYRRTLAGCGTNFRTKFGVVFVHPGARIGNDVRFGRFTSVGLADVHDDVMVAHFCSIMSGRRHHRTELTDTPMRAQDGAAERITIGQGTWIGANAIVMADIGKGVVIGAGAVVVKPVPDYAVVVGNPAKVVRFRNGERAPATQPSQSPQLQLVPETAADATADHPQAVGLAVAER
jgi:acetyltransferase-like isoleucine patch superfamily enzyme